MQTTETPLAELTLLEKNPRRHTPTQLQELKRSIEKFGQIRPIVADETGTVLAGNGLLIALRELGRETAMVHRVTGLSDSDKKRLILADNKIASLGVDDFSVVEALIQELAGELDIPGFDDDVLRGLTATPIQVETTAATYGTMAPEEREVAERAAPKIQEANQQFEQAQAAPAAEVNHCPTCGQRIWG